MYIQPDSDIRLLNNIPLDPDYINTILFDSASNQSSYFMGKTKYSFTDQSYQRVTRGVARIQRKADDLYDCNYMMFRNTAFGNKWFYAFITSIDYINNITSEIHFEIDVMQTWMFDYWLNYVFVEREHTVTDNIGDNIVPENLPTGEYIYNSFNSENSLKSLAIIVAIVDVDVQAVDGTVYDGVYGAAKLWAYPASGSAMPNINAKLAEYLQAPDSIVGLYMCPARAINATGVIDASGVPLVYGTSGQEFTQPYTAINTSATLDGYLPKCKKLYTYPYNYFYIDNGKGNNLEIRYEFCDSLTPRIRYNCTLTQPVEVAGRPTGYKGIPIGSGMSTDQSLFEETITLNGYPLCSWNMDAFKAWVAQNSIPILADTMKTMALGSISATGNLQAGNELNNITNVITQGWKAKIAADLNKGNFVNGGVNVAGNDMTFWYGRKSVNRQMAKIIDDYFDKFGYACNELKRPTLNSRPYWNYIKTVGCTIHGTMPADDEKLICSIYDRGITFWHNASLVGDYSQNNAPR